MDLIVGGGTYGLRAARFSRGEGREARVFDPDPGCRVARFLAENPQPGIAWVCGEIPEAYRFFTVARPARVFPTAPVHVAARIIAVACGLHEREGGTGPVAGKIPGGFHAGQSGADLFLSFNPAGTCAPGCSSPVCCPVTGEDRPVPLYARLREWYPACIVIESVQLCPGLGAIRGEDLVAAISRCRGRAEVCIATACRCHGVVTVLAAR